MSEQTRSSHLKERLASADVAGFDALAELALDMRSSWNHATDRVWRELDPVLWALTHSPWVVLQTVSREKLQRVLADPAFRSDVDAPAGHSEPVLGYGLQRRRHSAGRRSALRVGRAAHSRPGCGVDVREHGDRGHQRTIVEAEETTWLSKSGNPTIDL